MAGYVDPYVLQSVVAREVSKQLQPSLFGVLFQELRFKNAIDSAVQGYMPTAIDNALNNNSGLVANQVRAQLPSILNQQHYYLDGLNQQKALFTQKLNESHTLFQQTLNQHMVDLRNQSNKLIQDTVANVANDQYMVQQMKAQIEKKLNDDLDAKFKKHEVNANKTAGLNTFIAGICGVLLGGFIVNVFRGE